MASVSPGTDLVTTFINVALSVGVASVSGDSVLNCVNKKLLSVGVASASPETDLVTTFNILKSFNVKLSSRLVPRELISDCSSTLKSILFVILNSPNNAIPAG